MTDYTFDRDGQPITEARWSQLFHDIGYRRVAFHRLGQATVSTIWWGMDAHLDGPNEPPMIFETTVFFEGDVIETFRYGTEAEAVAGHALALDRLRPNGFGR